MIRNKIIKALNKIVLIKNFNKVKVTLTGKQLDFVH